MSKHAHRRQLKKRAHDGRAVRVEYPRHKEVIAQPTYTLQVVVPLPATGVEVSIDQADWRPCREALGLWWFDWTDYAPGEHSVIARTIVQGDVVDMSEPRTFTVV